MGSWIYASLLSMIAEPSPAPDIVHEGLFHARRRPELPQSRRYGSPASLSTGASRLPASRAAAVAWPPPSSISRLPPLHAFQHQLAPPAPSNSPNPMRISPSKSYLLPPIPSHFQTTPGPTHLSRHQCPQCLALPPRILDPHSPPRQRQDQHTSSFPHEHQHEPSLPLRLSPPQPALRHPYRYHCPPERACFSVDG
ncbi:hypothetical protein FB45DRAFT_273600 [Roridomyces roridus]|uniref:Uncharacterized protein n=1 Tax=Roridomyces roridus TaxID=1738132 RepID=A0AAD7B7T2_9AGAR|nr:hypothetical protein FB45DRAFT_273600 [Roridomyces roridus]